MTALDVHALQARLRAFAAARDWEKFHTPKNLAMALSVEVAELVELFQWVTPDESALAAGDPTFHEALADELADILIYVLRLADVTGVDLPRAVDRKIDKNGVKHPPTHT